MEKRKKQEVKNDPTQDPKIITLFTFSSSKAVMNLMSGRIFPRVSFHSISLHSCSLLMDVMPGVISLSLAFSAGSFAFLPPKMPSFRQIKTSKSVWEAKHCILYTHIASRVLPRLATLAMASSSRARASRQSFAFPLHHNSSGGTQAICLIRWQKKWHKTNETFFFKIKTRKAQEREK